jgi:hypothetical protein
MNHIPTNDEGTEPMGREIKRVALDFKWPIDKRWEGYLLPENLYPVSCPDCDGMGYSAEALVMYKQWYGNAPFQPSDTGSAPFTPETPEVRVFAERNVSRAPEYYGTGEFAIFHEANRLATLFNGSWSHHLSQADVDALVEAGRLMDFTHTWSPEERWKAKDPAPEVTADEVNRWSVSGFGHDSINCGVVIEARCKRMGGSHTCAVCGGEGSTEAYEGQSAEREAWEPTEPPAGEGWQVWETVSEGSPISPVFADREALIRWLMSPAYTWGTSRPLTREQAENFAESAWAPTAIIVNNEVIPGDQLA